MNAVNIMQEHQHCLGSFRLDYPTAMISLAHDHISHWSVIEVSYLIKGLIRKKEEQNQTFTLNFLECEKN